MYFNGMAIKNKTKVDIPSNNAISLKWDKLFDAISLIYVKLRHIMHFYPVFKII